MYHISKTIHWCDKQYHLVSNLNCAELLYDNFKASAHKCRLAALRFWVENTLELSICKAHVAIWRIGTPKQNWDVFEGMLQEQFGVNQSIALLFEVTKCLVGRKTRKYIQHRPNN